ncbi:hypothetical protein FRC06_011114 [Ceratobasidium sp. 370]|nr:hypothetical protein FRC06_011114 [Ceratobasidium sp. 370]
MPSLAARVGLPPPEPTGPPPGTSAQAKKRKSEAEACGNASQPEPLSVLSKRQRADFNKNANLLGQSYEKMVTNKDRREWLLQALENRGDKTDYRHLSEFQDPDVLEEIFFENPDADAYADTNADADADGETDPDEHAHPTILKPTIPVQVHVGVTKVLGTGGLASINLPALTGTDSMTIGLGGTPARPPSAVRSGSNSKSNASTADNTHPRPAPPHSPMAIRSGPQPALLARLERPSSGNTTTLSPPTSGSAPPKRVLFSRAQVEALRQKAASAAARARTTNEFATSTPDAVQPSMPRDATATASNTNDIEAPSAHQHSGSANMDVGPPSSTTSDAEGPTVSHCRPRRGRDAQLRLFGDATDLVAHTVELIKLEMVIMCGYPEHMPSSGHILDDTDYAAVLPSTRTLLDDWLITFWRQVNQELRPDHSWLPLLLAYIRRQLSQLRNVIKKASYGKIDTIYQIKRGHPETAARVQALLLGDKFLSPNLENDSARFQNEIIGRTIADAFFSGKKSLALVCTIIRHLIESFSKQESNSDALDSTEDADYFRHYSKLLDNAMDYNGTRFHMLDHTKTIPETPVTWEADSDVDEDLVEQLRELAGDDWPGDVAEPRSSQKGKRRMGGTITGPSGSSGR